MVRARLRELPLIHILTLAMAAFWRWTILADLDHGLPYLDACVIAVLAGNAGLLWSRLRVSLGWLRAIELGMVAMLGLRLVIVEYRLVLLFSLRDDPMMAQFIVKNVVLLTAILIPSYGLYVPKNWRTAALVVGPLALLPFVTLSALYFRHPDAMGWLVRGWAGSDAPRFLWFSFDALTLLILAVASTFGARAISLLRRQISEARDLGQYRLRRRIGAGGMGEVYLAEHQLLKRPCALKLLRPESVGDPRSLARFEREVRLTAALSHPNTVEIYDYGRTDKGTYYYVMEYLPGLSLAELVERHGAMAPGRVVFLLRQVCWALREAHAAGLIHRDIKPSNIFVSRRGAIDDVAKLLDFGLVMPPARTARPHLSGEGQVVGTPLYMSPEQARGRRGARRPQRHLLTGRGRLLPADRSPPLRGRARDGGLDRACARSGRAAINAPRRDPRRSRGHRVAVPGQGRRGSVCRLRKPGTGPRRVRCAGDWDRKRAARWWRHVDRPEQRSRLSPGPDASEMGGTRAHTVQSRP